MSLEHQFHKLNEPLQCAVLTVSDSRDEKTDKSGKLIRDCLLAEGHEVVASRIVADEPELIKKTLLAFFGQPEIQLVISTGGTGISPRDSTFETVKPLIHKEIPGFGELFRYLSYKEIGSPAMLSRAIGGLVKSETGLKIIFTLPGSKNACALAMKSLIVPQLGHIFKEFKKS
ncbi:molybdenum cofactor biosynthesis protein B [Candidatus Riflebacteria bacterium]